MKFIKIPEDITVTSVHIKSVTPEGKTTEGPLVVSFVWFFNQIVAKSEVWRERKTGLAELQRCKKALRLPAGSVGKIETDDYEPLAKAALLRSNDGRTMRMPDEWGADLQDAILTMMGAVQAASDEAPEVTKSAEKTAGASESAGEAGSADATESTQTAA